MAHHAQQKDLPHSDARAGVAGGHPLRLCLLLELLRSAVLSVRGEIWDATAQSVRPELAGTRRLESAFGPDPGRADMAGRRPRPLDGARPKADDCAGRLSRPARYFVHSPARRLHPGNLLDIPRPEHRRTALCGRLSDRCCLSTGRVWIYFHLPRRGYQRPIPLAGGAHLARKLDPQEGRALSVRRSLTARLRAANEAL